MKLEHQVCSLDLAKRLKELGVEQESLFWYDSTAVNTRVLPDSFKTKFKDAENWISAFTVAELGEMLPEGFQSFKGNRYHYHNKDNEPWWCDALPGTDFVKLMREQKKLAVAFGQNEADARAKMLIYLLENDLIKA